MLWLLACAPEYDLHVQTPQETWDAELVEVRPTEGSADTVLESPLRRTETFELDATERIDVLLVLDESISMEDDLNALRTGMASLLLEEAWPERTLFAVTSTTPASTEGRRMRHPAVTKVKGLPGYLANPGFQRFVDRQGIELFRELLPEDKRYLYALDGCGPTFGPDERNEQGIPCLLANTQIGLLPTRVEAGSVALAQMLETSAGQMFRPGAAVNVVFVSDTHDPGFFPFRDDERSYELFEDLLALQPTLAELEELAGPDLASFQVHAIAPDGSCGETSYERVGLSYFELVEQGPGLALDFCGEEDWTALVQQIAGSAGRVDRPVLALEDRPSLIHSVELDGVEVGYAQDDSLVILDAPIAPGSVAEVRYLR